MAWSINELVTKQYHDADSLVNFVSVKASDPNTVELKLSAPYANLLWVLTGRPGLVFDKDAKYDAKTQRSAPARTPSRSSSPTRP
mgnify:FL=1